VSLFGSSKRSDEQPLPSPGVGVLAVLFGSSPKLKVRFEEDVAIYEESGAAPVTREFTRVQDIVPAIESVRPGVLHLLAVSPGTARWWTKQVRSSICAT
jgi:hypothetical protein